MHTASVECFTGRLALLETLSSFVADEDENDRKSDFTLSRECARLEFRFVLVVMSRTGDGGGFRSGQNVSENVFHFALKR